jgi:hypothetical protein
MKIFKLILVCTAGVLGLFLLLEEACRFQVISIGSTKADGENIQKRMTGLKLDKLSLANEFGKGIFENPPLANRADYNFEKLKNYTYADIDQSPPLNRQWNFSADGTTRSSHFIKKISKSNDVIYDVEYKTNQMDKRFVEGQDKKKNPVSFILSAGDSFTFGEGVTQGQDYPSVLAAKLSDRWQVYNYGVSGDSANDFSFRAEINPEYFASIKEKEGVFIWTYLDIQMQRLVYPTTAYNFKYIANKPDYSLENDELVFNGFFKESKRSTRTFIDWMAGLAMTKTFNLEIPKVFTDSNYKLFFKLLNTTINHFESSGHKVSKKILVTFIAHHNFSDLERNARESGFEIVDIEKILYVRDRRFGGDLNLSIPVDGHPSPEAHWILGTALNNKIE